MLGMARTEPTCRIIPQASSNASCPQQQSVRAIPVSACRGILPALPRLPAWGQAPALLKGPGVIGIKLQRLVEVAACLLVAAQVQVGGAAAGSVRVIGVKLQRLVEVAEGLLVAAQVGVAVRYGPRASGLAGSLSWRPRSFLRS